jgi:hypothetical protein
MGMDKEGKVVLCLIKHYNMGLVAVIAPPLLTSALDGGGLSASRPDH